MFRSVTLFTFLFAMLALEQESGLRIMIPVLTVQTSDFEFLTVMVHVAAVAVHLAARRFVSTRVISQVSVYSPVNFGVALEASKTARPRAEIMARGAFCHPF